MKRILIGVLALALLVGASASAQEEAEDPAGLLFAMGGIQYYLRAPFTGGLADGGTLANLRAELGVGMLGRNNPSAAPSLYGGDFRISLSSVQLPSASVAMTDASLRGAYGLELGSILVGAFGGPGLYTTFLTAGGDATRVSVGFEAGIKAILTFGLYVETSYVAPEGLAVIQESLFLDEQPSGLRVAVGWNFLSATAQEVAEMSATAE